MLRIVGYKHYIQTVSLPNDFAYELYEYSYADKDYAHMNTSFPRVHHVPCEFFSCAALEF